MSEKYQWKYIILTSNTLEDLEKQINDKIEEWYFLDGSPRYWNGIYFIWMFKD